jgi:hypothetical protein
VDVGLATSREVKVVKTLGPKNRKNSKILIEIRLGIRRMTSNGTISVCEIVASSSKTSSRVAGRAVPEPEAGGFPLLKTTQQAHQVQSYLSHLSLHIFFNLVNFFVDDRSARVRFAQSRRTCFAPSKILTMKKCRARAVFAHEHARKNWYTYCTSVV